MPSTRQYKIATEMSRMLAQTCQQKLNNPLLSNLVIKETRISKDLSYAIVFFSTLQPSSGIDEIQQALIKATPLLRHSLAQSMKLRIVPKLDFRYDQTEDEADRIDQLLRDAFTQSD